LLKDLEEQQTLYKQFQQTGFLQEATESCGAEEVEGSAEGHPEVHQYAQSQENIMFLVSAYTRICGKLF